MWDVQVTYVSSSYQKQRNKFGKVLVSTRSHSRLVSGSQCHILTQSLARETTVIGWSRGKPRKLVKFASHTKFTVIGWICVNCCDCEFLEGLIVTSFSSSSQLATPHFQWKLLTDAVQPKQDKSGNNQSDCGHVCFHKEVDRWPKS